jgi:uncharacterized protein (DUF302 family)
MIYTIKSLNSVDTIKKEMLEHAEKHGLVVVGQYMLNVMLEGKGFPIEKEITVFELCNPPGAQEILAQVDAFSVYMPYRISIYEENGVTKLSTVKIDEILSSIDIDKELKAFMSILFYNLKNVMHSWT